MPKELSKIVNQINSLIEIGDGTWRKIAELLTEVRDGKLYVQGGYKTFSKFVDSEWGKTRNWAYNLIKSHAVVKRLTSKDAHNCVHPKVTEGTARALSTVPEELRVEVVEHINSARKPINSTTVNQAARVIKKTPPVDNDGHEIPKHAESYWNRRQEVQDVLTTLSRLRTDLEERMKAGDKMWLMDSVSQRMQSELKALYTTVKNFMPYAVCLKCQGHVASGSCDSCHDTGLISEAYFNNTADKRAIAIRHHANQAKAISARRV